MSTSRARARLGSWSLACAVAASSWCCGGDDSERTSQAAGGSTAESGTSGEAGAPQGIGASAGSSDVGPTLAEVCEKTCRDQAELGCAFPDCESFCQAVGDPVEWTEFPDEYLAMLRCQAENLGPTEYQCIDMGPDMGHIFWPAPQPGTVCEPEICAWTCADVKYGHEIVWQRCGCL